MSSTHGAKSVGTIVSILIGASQRSQYGAVSAGARSTAFLILELSQPYNATGNELTRLEFITSNLASVPWHCN
jgi:hypothetical protein